MPRTAAGSNPYRRSFYVQSHWFKSMMKQLFTCNYSGQHYSEKVNFGIPTPDLGLRTPVHFLSLVTVLHSHRLPQLHGLP